MYADKDSVQLVIAYSTEILACSRVRESRSIVSAVKHMLFKHYEDITVYSMRSACLLPSCHVF